MSKKALEESIEHWERLYRGEDDDFLSGQCALCQEYIGSDSGCGACPVYVATEGGCSKSPWEDFFRHKIQCEKQKFLPKGIVFIPACETCQDLAKKKIDFLKNVLEDLKWARKRR